MSLKSDIAIVAIGRNEGDRLLRCLASIQGQVEQLVYVDSGSQDGSVARARKAGVKVVELDPARPFSAARARNEGFQALGPQPPEFVQFIDGDCELVAGWLAVGYGAINGSTDLGLVTGWRAEINRGASIYNALCHDEWRRPSGEIETSGGDMLVRSEAFMAVGGFRDDVIAAEDDEFCQRLRQAGWRLLRVPSEMTRHDAHIQHFGEWWQRARRSGHGFAQVGQFHPHFFRRERARVLVYGVVLPLLFGLGLWLNFWIILGVAAVYAFSFLRIYRDRRGGGLEPKVALQHAGLLFLSKFPNALGMMQFYLRRLAGRSIRIIEYK